MRKPYQGKVVIDSVERVLDAFFKVDAAKIAFEGFDGQMKRPPFKILSLERGDAVAAVVHDPEADTVLLVEQFRYPTRQWIFELVAGMLMSGEDPLKAILRELLEEAGYMTEVGLFIGSFFLSPGGSSEKIYLYYVAIAPKDEKSAGGGLVHEGEEIRRHMIPSAEAFEMVESGVIKDAKTIIGLQWLKNHKF